MGDALLVLNAGSSSLKFSLFVDDDPPGPLLRGQIEELTTRARFTVRRGPATVDEYVWPNGTNPGHEGAIEFLFERAARRGVLADFRIAAAGHRIVHGGTRFAAPTLIDGAVLAELERLVPLAPLHQPHNLAAVKAVAALAPDLPQVACFDTAFHQTQPALAQAFALPESYTGEGIRRYGFHGLSYEYVASVLRQCDSRAALGRVVIAHLGNGASLCALRNGRSTATTMGFSALDGLVMGTRCGAIDPGVLLYLIDRHRLDAAGLRHLLYEESGLLGVSGISSDMRALLASPEPGAARAVDLFVYRIGRELGSMAAALGGLDALVFTAGVGENADVIRARVCRDAAWLGIELDEAANESGGPCISRSRSRVSVWVIPTNEELLIAQHTRRVVESRAAPSPHTIRCGGISGKP
jgi:acetate kinase